jgi:peptidoglycan/LPS O-acetylase OafA/YrhL
MRPSASAHALPSRFYSLDVLRGLGALAIVFNHWPNFFFYQGEPTDFSRLPWPTLLAPLYTNGWRAVDLFFCLSGFVFFLLYSEPISRRMVGWRDFSVLRFSRLYPLHLVTLLLAAGGQALLTAHFGGYFVCPENSLTLFLLHLAFASAWTGSSVSFNGPVWSVSVEVALYIGFFGLCRYRLIDWRLLLVYIGAGFFWTIHHGSYSGLARGVMAFFLGGLAFESFQALLASGRGFKYLRWLGGVTVALWFLVPLEAERHFLVTGFQQLCGSSTSYLNATVSNYLFRISEAVYVLVLFPVTLCWLALWETCRGSLGRRFAVLGDISYSTYLLHFPLQMGFLLAARGLGLSGSVFSSPLTLMLFFLVLIPLSLASHYWFERPMQSFLRKKLLPARQPAAATPK